MSKITKPNVNNTSPAYWEKVLASHGLGVDQPLTDNSELTGEPPNVIGDDFLHLRRNIDKGDRFMEAHEIKKAKGTQENRTPPDWAFDDKRIREILLRAFPKMQTSEAQRKKAGRWLRAIYLYYRMGLLRPVVLKELNIDLNTWLALIRSIRRAAKDLRADGSGKRACSHLSLPMRESEEGRK